MANEVKRDCPRGVIKCRGGVPDIHLAHSAANGFQVRLFCKVCFPKMMFLFHNVNEAIGILFEPDSWFVVHPLKRRHNVRGAKSSAFSGLKLLLTRDKLVRKEGGNCLNHRRPVI